MGTLTLSLRSGSEDPARLDSKLGVAADYGLPVSYLRRYWSVEDGELVGPSWEMTLVRSRLVRLQLQAERSGLIV